MMLPRARSSSAATSSPAVAAAGVDTSAGCWRQKRLRLDHRHGRELADGYDADASTTSRRSRRGGLSDFGELLTQTSALGIDAGARATAGEEVAALDDRARGTSSWAALSLPRHARHCHPAPVRADGGAGQGAVALVSGASAAISLRRSHRRDRTARNRRTRR